MKTNAQSYSLLPKQKYIYFIGAGGKTTLMFQQASDLTNQDHSVITTTTTKILYPTHEQSQDVIISNNTSLFPLPSSFSHLTLAKSHDKQTNKLHGYTTDELDQLRKQNLADYILVEADGAAQKSIKAHADHEPVISANADLVMIVIGIDCVGLPANKDNIHRCELFLKRLNKKQNTPITIDEIANLVFHPEGYLTKIKKDTAVIVILTKATSPKGLADAENLKNALKTRDNEHRLQTITISSLQNTPCL